MRLILFCPLFIPILAQAQTFTSWIIGDTSDVIVAPKSGIVLAGGGGENDNAMKWMLQRANGGDVLVLRTSGDDGYNEYFFNELGVPVNSVETIRFDHAAAAYHPYVLGQLSNAELVFLAGGNQYDYHQYWVNTPVEDTLKMLLAVKGITIGGISAGMAILGQAYYAPSGGSVDSQEALSDPFHPDLQLLQYGPFLSIPWMDKVITDTHYDQRDRAGRHFVFIALLSQQYQEHFFGIACNEYTTVCVDENGVAAIYGEYPEYEDYAYFLKTNCQDTFLPEVLLPATPITWNRNMAAVKVCRVPGLPSGNFSFDLNDWTSSTGGTWWNWYALDGTLFKEPTDDSNCDVGTSSAFVKVNNLSFSVGPIPAATHLTIHLHDYLGQQFEVRVYDYSGKKILTRCCNNAEILIPTSEIPMGLYLLQLVVDEQTATTKIVVR